MRGIMLWDMIQTKLLVPSISLNNNDLQTSLNLKANLNNPTFLIDISISTNGANKITFNSSTPNYNSIGYDSANNLSLRCNNQTIITSNGTNTNIAGYDSTTGTRDYALGNASSSNKKINLIVDKQDSLNPLEQLMVALVKISYQYHIKPQNDYAVIELLDQRYANEMLNITQTMDQVFDIYMHGYTNSKEIILKNVIALPAPQTVLTKVG
jgi:hypothetical protein